MNADLQAIMARRRRMAEEDEEGSIQDLEKSPTVRNKANYSSNGSFPRFQGSSTQSFDLSSPKLHGSSSQLHSSRSEMGTDLQSIMAHRRRLADGDSAGDPPPPPPPPTSQSSQISPNFKLNLAPTRKSTSPTKLSAPQRVSAISTSRLPPGQAPAAVSSPVRKELKKFGVSKDLQSILARRRRLSALRSASFDEESNMGGTVHSSKEEDPMVAVESMHSKHQKSTSEGSLHSNGSKKEPSESFHDDTPKEATTVEPKLSSKGMEGDTDASRPRRRQSIGDSSQHVDANGAAARPRRRQSIGGSSRHSGVEASSSKPRRRQSIGSSSHEDMDSSSARSRRRQSIGGTSRHNDDTSSRPRRRQSMRGESQQEGGEIGKDIEGASSRSRRSRNVGDEVSVDYSVDRSEASHERRARRRSIGSSPDPSVEDSVSVDRSVDSKERKQFRRQSSLGECPNSPDVSVDRSVDARSVGSRERRARRRSIGHRSHSPDRSVDQSVDASVEGRKSRRQSIGQGLERQDSHRKPRRRSVAVEVSPPRSPEKRSSRRNDSHHSLSRKIGRRSSTGGAQDVEESSERRQSRRASTANVTRSRESRKAMRSKSPGSVSAKNRGSRRSTSRERDTVDKPRRGGRKPLKEERNTVEEAFHEGKPLQDHSVQESIDPSVQESTAPQAVTGFDAVLDTGFTTPLEPVATENTFRGTDLFTADAFESAGDAGFGADFSAFPADFGDSATEGFPPDSKGRTTFDAAFDPTGFSTDTAFANFNSAEFIPAQPEKVWDSSPLEIVPKREHDSISLIEEHVFCHKSDISPSVNPLNGNLIYVSMDRDGFCLREVNPRQDNLAILKHTVLGPDFQKKSKSKFNVSIYKILDILKIAVGLHESQGQLRVRVAAVLKTVAVEVDEPMQLVAVWQWGYGSSHPVSLQYVMSPPSGSDFTFEVDSMQVADNLLFLAGDSPKGPCLFMTKPSARDTWSANLLGGTGKISAISVNPDPTRQSPYVAVGLTDRSISIWTYAEATKPPKKGKENTKRLLLPLCRLDSGTVISAQEPENVVPSSTDASVSKDIGHCTHFSWMPKHLLGTSQVFLVASFQNATAVYHVGLPAKLDPQSKAAVPLPVPSSNSQLSQTPAIPPVSAKRWAGAHDYTQTLWFSIGTLADPCLMMLMKDNKSVKIAAARIVVPLHHGGPTAKDRLVPVRIFASKRIDRETSASIPNQLYGSLCPDGVIYCGSASQITKFKLSPKRSPQESVADSLPASSMTFGLSSVGDSFLADAEADGDGCLTVCTEIQLERIVSNKTTLVWSRPTRRYFICRSLPGDLKETSKREHREERNVSGFGGSEVVVGGASSEMVAEMYHESLTGLIPFRVVRAKYGQVFAVFYRNMPDATSLLNIASSIALVDFSDSKTKIHVIQARDLCFLSEKGSSCRGLILSEDGSRTSFFTWDGKSFSTQQPHRPLLGVNTDDKFVECTRVLAFEGAGWAGLVCVGLRHADESTVVVAGELLQTTEVTPENWSQLLPNLETGHSTTLMERESVLSVVGLEHDDNGYRNFAIATSSGVYIVSAGLEVLAASRVRLSSSSLAPVGSFAVCFVAGNALQYLCCLDGHLAEGKVTALSEAAGTNLFAIRPDRVIFSSDHITTRLVEYGQSSSAVRLLTPQTKPILPLEPLLANAICVGGKQNQSTPILKLVIEKFGRMKTSMNHADNEGLGDSGVGLSSKSLQMLQAYGLERAWLWVLSGSEKSDLMSNTKILPSWLPVGPKISSTRCSNAALQVLGSGDKYLSEYFLSPDQPSALPAITDYSAYAFREHGLDSLREGDLFSAIRSLDASGSHKDDIHIMQLALLQKLRSKDGTGLLRSLSGADGMPQSISSGSKSVAACLSELAVALKTSDSCDQAMSEDDVDEWMKPLAPSLRHSTSVNRSRQRLLRSSDIDIVSTQMDLVPDPIWNMPCNEAKHVWNEGPKKAKDKMLLLDSIEDWLGRRRPIVLGVEGVSAAKDRGALADILNNEDASFGELSDGESENDGWADGVGEGRSDEANLSAYFRLSEGEVEDSNWQEVGFTDISPYQVKAKVIGDPDSYRLETSTSGVDEGEEGKVKSLCDLVYEGSGSDFASGLYVSAARGGSVDVGTLHRDDCQARQKCSIEFWYRLPPQSSVEEDFVLLRRTKGVSGDDLSKVAHVSDPESTLWDITLKRSGELEFRSCGGTSILSSNHSTSNNELGSGEDADRLDCAVFDRWNHVCIVLNSKGLHPSESDVRLYMKGIEVARTVASMVPTELTKEDIEHPQKTEGLLRKSLLIFGLGGPIGFRMTEIRVWACERSASDTQSFLYEYLNAAESKKKFQVKIKNKNKKGGLGKGGLLLPSKTSSNGQGPTTRGAISLAPTSKLQRETSTSGVPPQSKEGRMDVLSAPAPVSNFESTFNAFDTGDERVAKQSASKADLVEKQEETSNADPSSLWDTALPLSQQIRSSAAAAIIRGPPATRHFGGNRGGLPDFSGMERFGVGGVAICGSEKTIVWRDNEDPPALTYPIGASGAIVSDQMDDEGSEFLCCFLAKERRMVVFELQSRTVVVELQMTTKLNFWRFLPPEADENNLCFILVTPVGGFHWMPLEESPRPHQVWKRGPELQGKKVVSYEEGGTNGLDGADILSRVGLVLVTMAAGGGSLEAWIVPISGDSNASQFSDDCMGACFCQPAFIEEGSFLPLLVSVNEVESEMFVNVVSIEERRKGSVSLGGILVSVQIEIESLEGITYPPPSLAMGDYPEAICCSLANILVIVIRRMGLIVAYEMEDGDLGLIASEEVGHFVVDAVMRYSAEVGGAEIVMLLADNENPKDGRMVSFCFRSAA